MLFNDVHNEGLIQLPTLIEINVVRTCFFLYFGVLFIPSGGRLIATVEGRIAG